MAYSPPERSTPRKRYSLTRATLPESTKSLSASAGGPSDSWAKAGVAQNARAAVRVAAKRPRLDVSMTTSLNELLLLRPACVSGGRQFWSGDLFRMPGDDAQNCCTAQEQSRPIRQNR